MIPLFKVYIPENIDFQVKEVLYSGKLAYGDYTKDFEAKLKSFVNNEFILTLSCNSVFFALKVLGIGEGDEVIASPMACLATNQSVNWVGAKIVWADIDPLTGTLNPEDVKRKITDKTKVILHYHWGGYPGYIDEINELAEQSGIYVIEDASESFGAEYKGNVLGNTGTDIVCYSFTPVRLPNAIDGSGIAFKSKAHYEKALLMRDYGIKRNLFRDQLNEISPDCDILLPGDGCLMNNLSGLIGSFQMDSLPTLLKKQRINAEIWNSKLRYSSDLNLLVPRSEINPSFWLFTLFSTERDELLNDFRIQGFYASKVHIRNDVYSVFKTRNSNLPGVDVFSKFQLNIPCGWWIDPNDIVYGNED